MPTSQNGWSASPSLPIKPLLVHGVPFAPGVREGDVYVVLEYVATQLDARVEKAVHPGCWGFYYRANRNDPNSLSNHSSATAIDFNAPKHPNGVPTSRTWTPKQIAEIRLILNEVDGVVRWGGDYTRTPDAMHFEINAGAAAVAEVARKIKSGTINEEDDMTPEQIAKAPITLQRGKDNEPWPTTLQGALTEIENSVDLTAKATAETIAATERRLNAKIDALTALIQKAVAAGK